MYTFSDKKGRSLTLRPENTAGVVRAYLEHNLYSQKFIKVYYIGPMFRYERPQAGRKRQFYQIGTEAFGYATPYLDAEVIAMATHLFSELSIFGLSLKINSLGCKVCQKDYVEMLSDWLSPRKDSLCSDCVRRSSLNPRRVLDCKVKGCKGVVKDAPGTVELLCTECREHFGEVKEHLELLEIEYEVDPRLVRGLDYYSRTVFEIQNEELGAQNTVAAGGRYDYLVEELGGPPTPAIGFSAGVERIALSMREQIPEPDLDLYIAYLPEHQKRAFALSQSLRREGFFVSMDLEPKSLKTQFKEAAKNEASYTVIVGDEIKRGEVILKDMATGEQKRMAEQKLVDALESKDER
jgi:histidyl-tRNA synthetase